MYQNVQHQHYNEQQLDADLDQHDLGMLVQNVLMFVVAMAHQNLAML